MNSPRRYIASLFFFLLALLSKTVTCSLPAAILLMIWWKRGSLSWRDFKPLVPMFILGLLFSAITSHLEHTHVGARGPDFDWSIVDRCLIAGHAICFYAMKLVWPHPLIFMYPRWDLRADRAMQFVFPGAVVGVVTLLWFARTKIGRGPLAAVLFFIGTLFPALGFVDVYPLRYSFVADHFQYLASIGIITLVAAGFWRVSKLSVVVALPLAWIAWQQQAIYANAKTLWENTIAQNPNCWMAHTNLAGVLRAEGDFDSSLQQSRIALQLAPNEADTNYDLGVAFAKRSEWDAAIAQFRRAIQCDDRCAAAWSDLARTLWDHTDDPTIQAEAYANAKHALELQSTLADPHYVLGCVAQLSGNIPGAIEEFRKAVQLEEKDYHSHFNLGICLLQTGQSEYAAGEFSKVLKHDDKNASAWTMLGQACLRLGRLNEAQADFQRALRLNPNLPEAIEGLKKTQSR